jgi:hypothetical protein
MTHSLKPPGFNHRTYQVISKFQSVPFKLNLHRYTMAALSQAQEHYFEVGLYLRNKQAGV